MAKLKFPNDCHSQVYAKSAFENMPVFKPVSIPNHIVSLK